MSETELAPGEPAIEEHDPVTVADKPREPTPYEIRLRRENAAERVKRRAAETERDAARNAIEAARAEVAAAVERAREEARAEAETITAKLERERAEDRAEANRHIVRAKLEAAALAAGMVDIEGLQLLDVSKVTMDDSRAVKIPEDFFAKAKEAKPYLFGVTKSTSTPETPPKAEPPAAKTAKDMNTSELRALGQSLGVRF